MRTLQYFLITLLFSISSAYGTDFANITDNDDVYALSLTPSSKLSTAITENLDGSYDYQWDNLIVCYSPALGGNEEQEMLNKSVKWFSKTKVTPFFEPIQYARNIEQIIETIEHINEDKKEFSLSKNRKVLEWVSHNQLGLEKLFSIKDDMSAQIKGKYINLNNKGKRKLGYEFQESHFAFPKNSDFVLDGIRGLYGRVNSKKCDRILFTGNELVLLVLNEMKKGTDKFATKYRTYGSKHLLNGYKKFVTAKSSYLHQGDIYYDNFDDVLADAKVMWQSSDIYKRQKVSPLSLEKILEAETGYSYFDELSQNLDKKISNLTEVYDSGEGYFLGKRDRYNVDYEFCSIKYMENEETGFAVSSQLFQGEPKSSYIARDLKALFNHVIKDLNHCGIILAKNSDLKLLEKPFERKNIKFELLPVYKTIEEYELVDKKITQEKLQRKIWEQELATQQREVMCGTYLKALQAACAVNGENCLRWQYVKNSCN
ncbi:hypothetical protein [Thalassotalea castellviae]|uniref:Uncharacterized protein n=1 Tax=Thalassotalea castellviae TaxID=3075612 RepID=A0ABU2ZZQ5_9GAMM|nr:hypothetical protein [Thalassotalea sp. W431]MDT0603416.1 hypothetical protein [Thalassotalea sp. W431]